MQQKQLEEMENTPKLKLIRCTDENLLVGLYNINHNYLQHPYDDNDDKVDEDDDDFEKLPADIVGQEG